jgi:hypothetical protein
MESQDYTHSIRVGASPDGALTYLVDLPPEALPPVTRRDLERAWYAARHAALAEQWGAVRVFRFLREDGGHSERVSRVEGQRYTGDEIGPKSRVEDRQSIVDGQLHGRAVLILLDTGQLPTAHDLRGDPAVQELLALAERELIRIGY